jgi:hypothetical protein
MMSIPLCLLTGPYAICCKCGGCAQLLHFRLLLPLLVPLLLFLLQLLRQVRRTVLLLVHFHLLLLHALLLLLRFHVLLLLFSALLLFRLHLLRLLQCAVLLLLHALLLLLHALLLLLRVHVLALLLLLCVRVLVLLSSVFLLLVGGWWWQDTLLAVTVLWVLAVTNVPTHLPGSTHTPCLYLKHKWPSLHQQLRKHHSHCSRRVGAVVLQASCQTSQAHLSWPWWWCR